LQPNPQVPLEHSAKPFEGAPVQALPQAPQLSVSVSMSLASQDQPLCWLPSGQYPLLHWKPQVPLEHVEYPFIGAEQELSQVPQLLVSESRSLHKAALAHQVFPAGTGVCCWSSATCCSKEQVR